MVETFKSRSPLFMSKLLDHSSLRLHTKTLLPRFGMELTIARVRILSPEQGKLFLLPAEHRVTSLSRVTPAF
jgi:hypothetical protein